MGESIRMHMVKQTLSKRDLETLEVFEKADICFFRFLGGNIGETDRLVRELLRIKSMGVFVIGVFRFPFRFEGKRRLQTAILQYYRMREICDALTYLNSDGMMDAIDPGVSVQEASRLFDAMEEAPARAIAETIQRSGVINIDASDIQRFLSGRRGPVYIRTFEGDTFDEPLKYAISAPFLPPDFADGSELMVNIGYTQDVDMMRFQQMNLRLNDLFHKAELFKLGSFDMGEPGIRFRITLLVRGIRDPYPRVNEREPFLRQRIWLRTRWEALSSLRRKTGAGNAAVRPFVRPGVERERGLDAESMVE